MSRYVNHLPTTTHRTPNMAYEAPSTPHVSVSFAPLAAHFPALQRRLAGGDKCLADFCALVHARAQAEKAYADALQKIGQMPCGADETGSLFEAIDAIKCDALNHSRASADFARQLNEEVLQPSLDCRKVYRSMNGKLLDKTQRAFDEFGRARASAVESLRRAERARGVCSDARERLIDPRNAIVAPVSSTPKSPQQPGAASTGNFSFASSYASAPAASAGQAPATAAGPQNTTAGVQKVWAAMRLAAKEQAVANRACKTAEQFKHELDSQMELALDVFAQSEEARLNTLKDSLRRMVVVETSLLMNRQYDLGHIPKVTEEVSVSGDMSAFVNKVVTGSRGVDLDVPHVDSLPSLPARSAIAAGFHVSHLLRLQPADLLDQHAIVSAYLPPGHAALISRRVTHDEPISAADAERDVDTLLELHLSDIMLRAHSRGDCSAADMRRVNATLKHLGSRAPLALTHVLLHCTRNGAVLSLTGAKAFDFFSSLLRNVLRRLCQLREFITAQLVYLVAQRIVRAGTTESVFTALQADKSCAPVADFESQFFDTYATTVYPSTESSAPGAPPATAPHRSNTNNAPSTSRGVPQVSLALPRSRSVPPALNSHEQILDDAFRVYLGHGVAAFDALYLLCTIAIQHQSIDLQRLNAWASGVVQRTNELQALAHGVHSVPVSADFPESTPTGDPTPTGVFTPLSTRPASAVSHSVAEVTTAVENKPAVRAAEPVMDARALAALLASDDLPDFSDDAALP